MGCFLFILLFFFKLINYLFIYLWLCWVFVSVRGLPLVAASGGHSSSRCAGLSLSRPLLLRSTGSRRTGSVIVAHGPSCSAVCGILHRPGLEPVSPAPAGRFSPTAPPGKSYPAFICIVLTISMYLSISSILRNSGIFSNISSFQIFPLLLLSPLFLWNSDLTYLRSLSCLTFVLTSLSSFLSLYSSLPFSFNAVCFTV